MINKKELKYIIYSVAFAFFWFVLALPYLVKTFDGNSPFFQFLLFNVGLYAFLFIFLKSIANNTSVNIKTALGLTLMFIAMDIMMPEYHVAFNGTLIQGATLGISAADYSMGLFAQSLNVNFNLFGASFVYLFTYIFAPFVFLVASAKLLPNFVRHL